MVIWNENIRMICTSEMQNDVWKWPSIMPMKICCEQVMVIWNEKDEIGHKNDI